VNCHGLGSLRPRGRAAAFWHRLSTTSVRFPVIGEDRNFTTSLRKNSDAAITKRATFEQSYLCRGGDVVRRKCVNAYRIFKAYPEKSLKPLFIPEEPPQTGPAGSARGICHRTDASLARLAYSRSHESDVPRTRSSSRAFLGVAQFALVPARAGRSGSGYRISAFSYTPGEPGLVWNRCHS